MLVHLLVDVLGDMLDSFGRPIGHEVGQSRRARKTFPDARTYYFGLARRRTGPPPRCLRTKEPISRGVSSLLAGSEPIVRRSRACWHPYSAPGLGLTIDLVRQKRGIPRGRSCKAGARFFYARWESPEDRLRRVLPNQSPFLLVCASLALHNWRRGVNHSVTKGGTKTDNTRHVRVLEPS